MLDIFETPVTVTPQTENFKNFKFFKHSLEILNVYFWGDNVYFWGDNVYFWGSNVYFGGNKGFSKILGFLELLVCCSGGGGLGALWVGRPRRGFENTICVKIIAKLFPQTIFSV